MSSDSKLLIGLILGAAAGAVAGLLIAPATGKETREKIKNTAGEFKEDLDKKFSDLSSKIKDLDKDSLKEFKGKFENVKEDVKEKYSKIASKVKNLEKEIENKIEEIRNRAKDLDPNKT